MELSLTERLSERLAILKTPFPLQSLLLIYTKAYKPLYLNHFEGLQLLIKWMQPISPSTFHIKYIPTYLLTYEMQEIAKHTGNHISQIYQELTHLNSLNSLNGAPHD